MLNPLVVAIFLMLIFMVLSITFIVLYVQRPSVCAQVDVSGSDLTKEELANRWTELNNQKSNVIVHTETGNKTKISYSSMNPFKKFDKIYYINLDDRKLRKYNIEQELKRMGIDEDRIKRIPGIKAKFGALGCSMAHLAALKDAKQNQYSNCLILEDDFVFKFGRETTCMQLTKFWDLNVAWDMLMLACYVKDFKRTNVDFLISVQEAQTTGGYAVNASFLDALIDNVQNGIDKLQTFDAPQHDYCIDIYWKRVQRENKWFTFRPVMGHQRSTYSDIEHQLVTYNDKDEVVKEIDDAQYLICVKTCKPRLKRNQDQLTSLNMICGDRKVQYLYYYGVEDQTDDFVLDLQENIVRLKCKDDYINLCRKFGQMLHFLNIYRSVNKSVRNLKGIFFTDDDIKLNSENFYATLEANSNILYWGNIVQHGGSYQITSGHLNHKSNESSGMKEFFEKNYPELIEFEIAVPNTRYCSGGGFYLKIEAVQSLTSLDEYFVSFPSREELLRFHKKIENGKTFFSCIHVFDDLEIGVALHSLNINPEHKDMKQIVFWEGL